MQEVYSRRTLAPLVGALGLVLTAAVISLLGPLSAALVIGGAFLSLVLLRRRELAYYLLILAVPFGSLVPLPLAGANVTAADGLLLVALAMWLARQIAGRQIILRPAPLLIPFLLFLFAAGLSLTVALSLQSAAKEFIKWVEMTAVYWLVVQEFGTIQVKRSLAVILLAGAAEAALGLYQSVLRVGPEGFLLFGGASLRAFGTFDQPNPFAGYLGLIIPLAFGLILGLSVTILKERLGHIGWRVGRSGDGVVLPRRDRSPSRTKAPNPERVVPPSLQPSRPALPRFALLALAVTAFGLTSIALFLSLSRGAWIAVAAALVLTTVIRSKHAAVFAFTLALLLVFVVLLGQLSLIPDVVSERFSGVGDYFGFIDVRGVTVNDANFALVERMAHWQAAWGMFQDHPLFGIGIGNYASAYPAYALPHWDDPLGHAHNYYLNVLAETGLVGFGAYLAMWIAIFWAAWRSLRSTSGLAQFTAAGLFGVLVALSVHNLFDDLFVHSMQIQVGITLGLMHVIGRAS